MTQLSNKLQCGAACWNRNIFNRPCHWNCSVGIYSWPDWVLAMSHVASSSVWRPR